MAAASARDPTLANETFSIALTDELPAPLIGRLISEVASQGEHRDLAWNFVKANFTELAAKQGPSFQNNFPASLMTNFTDAPHAEELANFAPAHSTSGGRLVAARAYERIMTDADFSAQQLPTVNDVVKRWMARQ
jgi:ERAP1-like C-terminal domain